MLGLNRKLISIISVLLLLTNFTSATIQYDYYASFKNLTVLDGLSNNNVLDILQDEYGYIWIATENGLNRYDGYKFRVFKHEVSDTNSLSNNYITSLCIDANGQLWVGTKQGLNKYNSKSETFTTFPVRNENQNGISDASVRKVYNSGKDAILWVETLDGVLNQINIRTKNVSHYKHKKVLTEIYDYHSIFQDSKGDIYLGGRDFGPYRFDTLERKLNLIKADYFNPKKKRDQDIACIFEDRKGRYWMSATDGFYQYYPDKDEFKKWLSLSTYSIIDKSENELWLATGNGLALFNVEKEHFTFFQYNQNDKQSIANNRLSCVFKDKNENVWVGSRKGLSILLARDNFFNHYHNVPEITSSLSANKVSCFLEDVSGNIWIGTMDGGINKWNRSSDWFSNYNNDFGKQKVSCLYEDSYQNLWIGLWSGTGFYKFDASRSEFTKYAYNSINTKSDWYNAFFEDHQSRFWVGFWGATGVQMFNRKLGSFEPYGLNLIEAPMRKHLEFVEATDSIIWCPNFYYFIHGYNHVDSHYEVFVNKDSSFVLPEWRNQNHLNISAYNNFLRIYSTIKLADNKVIFATNNGLIIHDYKRFEQIENELLNEVTAMATDKESIVLAGQSYLVWYDLENQMVTKKLLLSNLGIEAHQNISAIAIINNQYLIGGKNGLQVIVNDTTCIKPFETNELLSSEITAIKPTKDKQVWVATKSGAHLIDENFATVFSINRKKFYNKGLISESVNCLHFNDSMVWFGAQKGFYAYNLCDSTLQQVSDLNEVAVNNISHHQDILWLATEEGLVKYDIANMKTTFLFKKSNHQLSSRLTKFIHQDKKGYVWIGTTQNGLNYIDTSTFHIEHFLSNLNDSSALWGDYTTCFLERKNGDIVIGAKGLNVFNRESKTFSHFTANTGLISDNILGLAEDKKENLWILSDKGLMRLSNNGNVKVYAEDWGLMPHEFNIAMYTLNSDEILFGSDNGFYVFNPMLVDSVKFSQNIEITGFKIFNNTVKTDFTKEKTIELDYSQNFFTFEFSDMNIASNNTTYLYQLQGIDKNWVSSNSLNFASYTNIPHGKYAFLVTTPRLKEEGIPPQKLKLVIHPPFWKTTWFIILEILLVVAVMFYFYNQRIKKFKLREKHLQLEQKLLRSQMNPHFVFNALIAIQSFIFKNNAREAGRYLSKFAKLMRLFLQNTRHEFIPLSQELETLEYYMQMQRLRLNDSFEFNIDCVNEIDPELIEIPPMMAQPFIENSIEHGFKGIDYLGLVTVNYALKNNAVVITISDNGKGIKKSQTESSEKNHKSLATTITRERLASFSKKTNKYELLISDFSEASKQKSGTEVIITVPYKEKF